MKLLEVTAFDGSSRALKLALGDRIARWRSIAWIWGEFTRNTLSTTDYRIRKVCSEKKCVSQTYCMYESQYA